MPLTAASDRSRGPGSGWRSPFGSGGGDGGDVTRWDPWRPVVPIGPVPVGAIRAVGSVYIRRQPA
ncbi:hypothetical protein GCM10028858_16130 [Halorubrum pallidum]